MSSLQTGQNRGVDFDSVPQILQTQVFIGAMLIIVVIGDRQDQDRCFQNILDDIQRQAATHGRGLDQCAV